jgi:hypothetical protein
VQISNGGGNDGFVARFDVNLRGVRQATYRGGLGNDSAYALALSDTQAYIAGETASPGFPSIVPISAQSTPGGGSSDGFISMLPLDLKEVSSDPAPFSFAPVSNTLPLTVQTSAPAKVTPNGNALVYVDGQPGSAWCASSAGAACTCDLMPGNTFTSGALTMTAAVPYYVCVRHISSAAPNAVTESTLHISSMAATFRVGTGSIPGLGCTLDADGNGLLDALTDGLILIRAMFGLSGPAVTNGAVYPGAPRQQWSDISAFFNANCGTTFAP